MTTADTITALKALFGVGVMMDMYGKNNIQHNAVTIQPNCEVVPAIRETKERDKEPETGALPVIPATMHAIPCAYNSPEADHEIPFSVSNPEAIPTIERKLIAAKIAAVMPRTM